jgi:L-alanine-DL-glutamate epimerase-like enolase superfamily enzyme
MRGHSWWYGVGGIASFAISAIDMALWDIAGKRAGLSLSDLVGGAARSRLPATASAHVNKATISACITEVAGYVEQGFRSVKLGFAKKGESRIGFEPTASVGFIAELRRALGDGIEILVDFGNGVTWDEQSRIDAIGRMTDCNIGWIEEPFHPSDLAAHRRLRESVAVPIATGEREWTVAGYERLIDSATVDIVGVDPARAEGITGFRAVDALVGKAGLTINAHAWSTAITTAASLHLSLASDSTRLFELKPFPVAVQQDLVERPIWHRDGYVVAPKGTGLGVEIREGILHRYRIGP